MKREKLYRCCNTCKYKNSSFYGCSKASECYNGFTKYEPIMEPKEKPAPSANGTSEEK